MPIIYLPRAIEATDGLELLAASFMMRLTEIEILLKRLANVENDVHSDLSDKNLITISLRVVLISLNWPNLFAAFDIFLSINYQPERFATGAPTLIRSRAFAVTNVFPGYN